MTKVRFILGIKNGIIERSSKFANKYLKNPETTMDMNLFLREHENFVSRIDTKSTLPAYNFDDLPLASSLNPQLHKKSNTIYSQFFDTDLATTKILDTNETVYLEKALENETCYKYLNEGCSFKDVANILHKTKDYPNAAYIYESFELIKSGYPLELVLKYMDDALLKSQQKYSSGLIKFVAENPGKKHLIVTRNRLNREEVLDTFAMKHFNILENSCNSEKELKAILRACRCTNRYGNQLTDEKLFNFAYEILNKNKTWTSVDSELIETLKILKDRTDFEEEILDYKLYSKACTYLQQNKSSEAILKQLQASI